MYEEIAYKSTGGIHEEISKGFSEWILGRHPIVHRYFSAAVILQNDVSDIESFETLSVIVHQTEFSFKPARLRLDLSGRKHIADSRCITALQFHQNGKNWNALTLLQYYWSEGIHSKITYTVSRYFWKKSCT